MVSLTEHWALALHGGAGVKAGRSYERAEACLADLVRNGAEALARGAASLDVVEDAVAAMEASGLFVAGRGSAPNQQGKVELDASLMDGATGRCGAVSAVSGIRHPIRVARSLLDENATVFLTADGAAAYAVERGLGVIEDIKAWLTTPDGWAPEDAADGHGTVGAVALDRTGRLAAGTSTGGIYGAPPGRVGDSAVIGAGTWADSTLAVSCTGEGEAFIRAGAASDLAARVCYTGQDLSEAGRAVLATVRARGGEGGLIAVDRTGEIVMLFDTDGMKRASASSRRRPSVGSVGEALRST